MSNPDSSPSSSPGSLPRPPEGAHVRGTRTYYLRAGAVVRFGATVLDGSMAVFVFFVLHRMFKLSPVPHLAWIAGCAVLLGLFWLGGRMLAGRSPGESVWRLRICQSQPTSPLRAPLLQPARYSLAALATGIILTAFSVLASAWSIDLAVFKQPLWARADLLKLEVFLPDMKSRRWEVLPFFYTLGAWPRAYGGKPILYSLPYEKGPPSRFVGHLTARWESPGTQVTFEGPKTPKSAMAYAQGERTPRDLIRECLLEANHSWNCLQIREATLQRHLSDVQQRLTGSAGGDTALAMNWSLRWFTVRNPAIPPSEQAQGIYISAVSSETGPGRARGPARGEERYVLITENGTHQAISLTFPEPQSPAAIEARAIFVQAIRSLRASDDLGPGRAWADSQLGSIQLGGRLAAVLGGAPPRSDAETAGVIEQLAQAQALLLAKISVQPSVYDSYFLLGSTAHSLSRLSRLGASAGQLEGLELAAASKPMILSAYRYAQDLAPHDARTTRLQGFWLEAQKR